MSINVIMPVLGMAQETGTIVRWLKSPGEQVKKGEPLIEVETDKAIAEIEAPGDGILANITANDGDVVPVAAVIAQILAPGEPGAAQAALSPPDQSRKPALSSPAGDGGSATVSPLARRIAEDNGLDLRLVEPKSGRIEKADVLAYLERQKTAAPGAGGVDFLASPKARRLMKERGIAPALVRGSGPGGAILAADLEEVVPLPAVEARPSAPQLEAPVPPGQEISYTAVGTTWRIMSERTTQSWQSAPHFYLMREINVSQLVAWREEIQARAGRKITFTDLLLKVTAEALRRHPRLNVAWQDGRIAVFKEINLGLAVATQEGLVVPVIRNADQKGVSELAAERERLVKSAQENSLRLEDIRDGTFTLTNLGMYGVDAFNAIINPPQAAILAVGRIAERVVPLDGQVVIQPTMIMNLSCDHRAVDGALGARFLQSAAEMIEQPLRILD